MRYTTDTEVVHTTTGATGVVIDPVGGYRVRVRWAGGRISRVPVEDLRPAKPRAMSPQELLDKYIAARRSVIGEFSGDMTRDYRVLIAEVESYAVEHDLNTNALADTREMVRMVEECE